MRLAILLAALSTLLPSALPAPTAPPTVTITNNCPFSVWITSVSGTPGPTEEVTSGTDWLEPEYFDGIGTAVKITREADSLWTNAPVLILGYTYKAGESIYYDLGTHAGYNFAGYTVKLQGAGGDVVWVGEPEPQDTMVFWRSSELTLGLCV